MDQNTKRTLTHQIIQETFIPAKGWHPYRRLNLGFSAFLLIFGIPCFLSGIIDLIFIGVVLLLPVPGLLARDWKHHAIIRSIAKKEYYICDTCCNGKWIQHIERDDCRDSYYYLLMDFVPRNVEVNFPHVVKRPAGCAWNPYDEVEDGDRCYLIYTAKKTVLYVINQKNWTLSMADFTLVDKDTYKPIKRRFGS